MKKQFAPANSIGVISLAVLITVLLIGGFTAVVKNQEARAEAAIARAVTQASVIS
jgi:hypothetical protein